MRYQVPVKVPRSGNPWIDGLTDGFRWGVVPDNSVVGYTFISDTRERPGGEFAGYPSWGWSDYERRLMNDAMQSISSVSGIQFVDRGDDNDDEVEIWFYNLDEKSSDGSFGFAYTPGSDSDEGLVALNWSLYQEQDGTFKHDISSGSFYGITFLHELCHALGLKHPHDLGLNGQPRFPGLSRRSNEFRDAGDFGQNAHPWTQLSYVDKGAKNGLVPSRVQSYGFLQTPGALDTAALQWLYGINDSTESGANVYRLPTKNKTGIGWKSIWDTGGIDRIDGSKARQPVRIDLRNASLDRSDDAGGYPSRMDGIFGGFTIAHDWDGKTLDQPAGLCVIENATGGQSDDILIGNNVSNVLRGRRGDDILYSGGGGRNRSIGGRGQDQFWLEADDQSLTIIKDFSKRDDHLVFDVKPVAIELREQGNHTEIVFEGSVIAQLKNLTGLTKDDHMIFSDFDAL